MIDLCLSLGVPEASIIIRVPEALVSLGVLEALVMSVLTG